MKRAFACLLICAFGCAEDDNRVPALQPINDLSIEVNTSGRIDLTAADLDGDRLEFNFTIDPMPPTETMGAGVPNLTPLGPNQAIFTWTPGIADANGERSSPYTVTFVVTDGRGGRDTETIQINVTNSGVAGSGTLRFVEPAGAGLAVDLAQTPCVDDLAVRVQGELIANEDVTVRMAEPVPAQAFLTPDAPGKNKLFAWCPTEAQLDASLAHTITFTATYEGAERPLNKRFQIRFKRQAAAGCPGEPPDIRHTPPARFEGPLNYEVRATITDDVGFKSAPILAFDVVDPGADEPGVRPDTTGWQLVEFAPGGGDEWVAQIPNQGLAAGAQAVVRYVILATDNDDADGTRCDHTAESDVFRFTIVGGGGGGGPATYGFCAPCISDEQCGGAADRCVDLQGEAFCGRSCEDADCRDGEQCLIVTSVDDVDSAQCLPRDLDCGQICSADQFEQGMGNNSVERAAAIEAGSFPELSICDDDIDYYRVRVEAEQSLRVRIEFPHAQGDIDLAMKLPETEQFAYESAGYEDVEEVFEACIGQPGEAIIAVVGYQQPRNRYRMTVEQGPGQCNLACNDDQFEGGAGNDSFDDFFVIDLPYRDEGLVACPQDDDYFGFEASEGDIISVLLGFEHAAGNLQLELYNSNEELIAASRGTGDGELIEVVAGADDIYIVRIFGATRSVSNAYLLDVLTVRLQSCATTRECPAGQYCTGEFCIEAACDGFGRCAQGHACVPGRAGLDPGTAGGACLAACNGDNDCRNGEACKRFEDFTWQCGETGAGAVGGRCGSFEDCAGAMICFPVPGGYCAAGGCAPGECGPDAVCGTLLNFDACLKRCANDGDCRSAEGYTCQDVGGARACVP